MEKITALYSRVSTYIQIERGESIKNQRSRLKQYADSSELHSRFYVDAGFSARHIQRPQLTRLLSDIRKGKVNRVLVTKLDRITRSIRDLIALIGLFEDFGVSFQALDQSLDTSTASGRAQVQLLGVLAEWERNIISERLSEDMRHRARQGKWNGGPIPFGYRTFQSEFERLKDSGFSEEDALREAWRHCPKEKKLYPFPPNAQVVKKIFEEYLKKLSVRGVTDCLNRQGLKSPEDGAWTTQTVNRILRCQTYVGKIIFGRRASSFQKSRKQGWVEAEGVHEPIIERTVFDRVQKLIRIHRNRRQIKGSKYLLSGILKCGCGGKMHGYSHHKSKERWRYYRCSTYLHKGRSVCEGRAVRRDLVENTVVKYLLSMHEKQTALASLQAAFEKFMDHLKRRKETLSQERDDLLKRQAVLKSRDPEFYENCINIERIGIDLEAINEIETVTFEEIKNNLKDLPQKWKRLGFYDRKQLLQSYISSVKFTDRNSPLEITISLVPHFTTAALDWPEELYCMISLELPKAWEKLPKPKTFGEHLRIARLKKKWLMKDLAAQLRVSVETITNWERRRIRPDYSFIRKLKMLFPELRLLNPALIYPDYSAKPKTNGEKLKKKRFDMDLSQQEFAERLGVHADTIRDWETGRTRIHDVRFEEIIRKSDSF